MATAFDVVLRYPDSTIQQVHDMLADPGFREQVCVFQGDLRHVVRIERARERLEVEVERVQSSNGVPSVAKSFVGDEITFVQREDWSSLTKANVWIDIPGKPGRASGTATLTQVRNAVEQHLQISVKVSVPLVGRSIETMVAELIQHALRAENHVGEKWLAQSR